MRESQTSHCCPGAWHSRHELYTHALRRVLRSSISSGVDQSLVQDGHTHPWVHDGHTHRCRMDTPTGAGWTHPQAGSLSSIFSVLPQLSTRICLQAWACGSPASPCLYYNDRSDFLHIGKRDSWLLLAIVYSNKNHSSRVTPCCELCANP